MNAAQKKWNIQGEKFINHLSEHIITLEQNTITDKEKIDDLEGVVQKAQTRISTLVAEQNAFGAVHGAFNIAHSHLQAANIDYISSSSNSSESNSSSNDNTYYHFDDESDADSKN